MNEYLPVNEDIYIDSDCEFIIHVFIIVYRIFPVFSLNLSSIVFFPSLLIFFKENGFLVSLYLLFSFSSLLLFSVIPFYPSTLLFITLLPLFLLQSTGEYLIFPFLSNCLIFFFSFFHNFHLYVTLYVIFFIIFRFSIN